MRSRISAASVVAVAVLAVAALFHGPQGAIATQGQAVVAGQDNTETVETRIYNTNVYTPQTCGSAAGVWGALLACGHFGVTGVGAVYGLTGRSSPGGQAGVSGQGPTGVRGITLSASSGIAVEGKGGAIGVSGTGGDGVYGEGTENGVHAVGGTFGLFAEGDDYGAYARGPNYGVFGQATSPTGVGLAAAAEGPTGTALSVTGKAEFSRSGRTVVHGTTASPKSFVVISGVALTAKSLVLVTPQKAVAGVFVIGAVPNVADGKVRIVLNKAVSASYPVAWFLIERP